jgi:hypothetical protein
MYSHYLINANLHSMKINRIHLAIAFGSMFLALHYMLNVELNNDLTAAQLFAGGRMEMLMLIATGLTLLGVGGYYLEGKIVEHIKEELRQINYQSEARNNIRHGYKEFVNYEAYQKIGYKEVALSSLTTAIIASERALEILAAMKEDDNNRSKQFLTALAAANLSYFYADLSRFGPDKIREESRKKALQTIEKVTHSAAIEFTRQCQEQNDCNWWDVVESRLYVRWHCSNECWANNDAWSEEKSRVASEVYKLTQDHNIPSVIRGQMREDWSKALKGYGPLSRGYHQDA